MSGSLSVNSLSEAILMHTVEESTMQETGNILNVECSLPDILTVLLLIGFRKGLLGVLP